jgi:AraC-like DNA-binding protein
MRIPTAATRPRIREGFPGQRSIILPRPAVHAALGGPDGLDLLPTDIGYYPDAAWHEVSRPAGSPQLVLILCLRGSGYARIRDRVFAVTPGHALLLPPGVAHAYGTGRQHPWSILWLHLAGRRVKRLHALLTDDGASPLAPTGHDPDLPALFDEIMASLQPPFSSDQLLLASLTTGRLMAKLIVHHRTRPDAPATRERIDAVVAYLQARLAAPHTVPDLARLANLSPSHFAAAFKRHTSFPPLDFLIRLRMQRAAHLLDSTSMPVKAIAASLGYADPLYFSRTFHRIHAISPARYRSIPKG